MARKKTTVDVTEKSLVLSKIVKFTYLQSLAVDGGLTTVGEIGGETEAKQEENVDVNTRLDGVSRSISKTDSSVLSVIFSTPYFPGVGDAIAKAATAVFGKKRSTSVKTDYKESGWTVSKVWNQPQFDIIRYAIGIKDLTVAQFTYEETSELISTPWTSPKEIVKVVLNVDQFVPSIFPPGNYIEYYIKPNTDDSDWIQINPLGFPSIFREDGSIVPRVISFNTEQPLSSRLEDSYVITSKPVKEIVFRALLKRPTTLDGTTASANGYSPVLRSYRLLMTPKNGL